MREDLGNIDTSPIEDLVQIKQEEQVLHGRLAKMEADKGRVSDVVHSRVRKDYESKQQALEQRARPLKDKARREYAKLVALHAAAKKAVEEAHVDKEELEYRHELGEFEKKEFEERIEEAEQRVEQRQQELDEVEELKTKFVGAFHSEAELISALPPPPVEQPTAPPRPVAAPAPEPRPVAAPALEPRPVAGAAPPPRPVAVPAPPPRPVAPAAAVAQESPTRAQAVASAVAPGATTILPSAAAPGSEPTPAAPAPEGATVVFSMPRIVALNGDRPGDEIVLKPDTTVGRSPKCQIQLEGDRVSRQHVRLLLGPNGYQIMDLGSQNGTKVNGQQITQHLLVDGDEIQIGPYKFVYHN